MKPNSKPISMQDLDKKVFDVARPGKTPASTTSRPVIVGHRPQVQDPMMTHDISSDHEQPQLLDGRQKVVVQPQTQPGQTAVLVDVPPVGKKPVGAVVETNAQPDTQTDVTALQTPEHLVPTNVAATNDAVVAPPVGQDSSDMDASLQPRTLDIDPVPVSVGQSDAPPAPAPAPNPDTSPQPSKPAEDSVAAIFSKESASSDGQYGSALQTNAPNKTFTPLPDIGDNDTYPPRTAFVSHHRASSKGRVGKVIIICLLVLLLVAVVGDILLDAGFLTISSIPHTHFF